jgi:hypothetical protein
MDAVEYLVVYFISESISESKLTKTILFYVDSKPTCAIRIKFETMYLLLTCHISSYIGSWGGVALDRVRRVSV